MPDIKISTGKYSTPAYVALPENKQQRAGVILIHEVWGLNKNIRGLADRLAVEGYAVVAPELVAHTGITKKIDQSIMAAIKNPATRDEAQKKMREAMGPIMSPEFGTETMERLKDCIVHLRQEYKVQKIAAMGFCLGGTYSYALAAADSDLAAALPFYGQAPQSATELAKIICPIMAFYGEQDVRLTEGLPQLEQSMKNLGKDFQYKVYPNTGHAFMNDTNPSTYNKEAADDAWQMSLAFLAKHA